jgi:uncharacterized Zn finger protein
MSYWEWQHYKPAVPKKVNDGIKARSRQGDFGETQAGRKWISLLENAPWSNRLARGKRYARMGQVRDFSIKKGEVTASVQGTRAKPYNIRISLQPFPKKKWERLKNLVSENPLHYSTLKARKFTVDFQELLEAAGISLLPWSTREIKTSCSCPDTANPCKHIAAVFYIVGEALDENPFLLFQMRGVNIEDFLNSIEALSLNALPAEEVQEQAIYPDQRPDRFWKSGSDFAKIVTHRRSPDVPLALIKLLGVPKFLPRTKTVQGLIERAYTLAAKE